MHAFLIIGANEELKKLRTEEIIKRENVIKQLPFSLQKIDDARDLKKIIKFKFNEKTAIVINDIDKASEESLNAFLKNLEEPNKNIIYILTATNLADVLPTITSRCEVIKVSSTRYQVSGVKYQVSGKTSSFKDVLNIKDRDEAIKYIENAIFFDKSQNNYNNMENYLYTLRNLKLNGNVSLQMTNLVVKMGSHG